MIVHALHRSTKSLSDAPGAPPDWKVVTAPRPAFWAAVAFVFFAIATPNCCLAGRHAAGFGMEAFWPICHAVR